MTSEATKAPKEVITVATLSTGIQAQYQEILRAEKLTQGVVGTENFLVVRSEQRTIREGAIAEIVRMAAEALATLGYEEVMRIIKENTGLYFSPDHRQYDLRGSILKYVVDNLLPKPRPRSRKKEGGDLTIDRSPALEVLKS
ncbi:MAG: hypothetical protein WC924_05750 [Candidatus Gracilibacteria bacterium]